MSDATQRRVTISTVGYVLIVLGLLITLFAMTLDRWTQLRELEMISGGVGLLTSVVAAIVAACDLTASQQRCLAIRSDQK